MKKILLFAFLLCSFSAFAQYPAQPTTKQELGRQTTGDGLIYRGSGAPAYTPANNRNAWIYYDTTNNRLYKSRLGSWSLMVQDTSSFNEIQMPYIVNDTLYLTQNVTGEPLTRYVNRVWPITNLSDTTSITGENQGDVAIVASGDTVAFRGSAYWNPFSGGGGGGSFNDFILAADSGSPATITDGQTVTIAGGTGLTSTISGNTVTTNLDNTAITAATYGSATQVSQITFDAQGRGILAANVSILLPISAVTALPDSLAAKITRITSTNNYLPRWVGTSMGNSFFSQDAVSVMMDANKQLELTGGTTANRPTGVASAMYYNTSNNWFDFHNGTAWFNPARSATANGLFSPGSVLFGGSAGTIQQDLANFFWDDANNRLGLGTTGPQYSLDIIVSASGAQGLKIRNSSSASATYSALLFGNDAVSLSGGFFNNSSATTQYAGANSMNLVNIQNAPLAFGTFNQIRAYISGAGLFAIGNTSPQRTLHVTGEARITDLTTDTPTRIVGADADGDLGAITATITTAGTTGNVTINALAGTVNIAAAGTTVTVTNSNVTANSLVFCTLRTNDATATVKNVVPAAGSFTINLGAAATGEVSIGFFVVN